MKTYFKSVIFLLTIVFTSCQDVIDVDVQTAPSRLVIEASIDWEKGTAGNSQKIKLSKSTSYFDTTSNMSVTSATVKVVNTNDNSEFVFTHQGSGVYSTNTFIPVVNDSYNLQVIYEGEAYTANETLTPVTDIVDVNQSIEGGFNDEDLEVNIAFVDPEDEENYYLFKFQKQGDLLPSIEDWNDEFINGNEATWWYEKEEGEAFQSGDVVDISFFGISESYHNYIRILIEQSEGAGPFSATPVPLKGNCINESTPANYAFGYFRLTQVVKDTYTFQ